MTHPNRWGLKTYINDRLGCYYSLKTFIDVLLKISDYLIHKGLSILPVFSKQTNVSREFWELHSMTGTVETVFASSIARCDAFWAIYFTLKLFLCLLLHWYEYFLLKKKHWNFCFHGQILKRHNSLKRWNFWKCKTSFEKLIARALRCNKNLAGFILKYSKKNSNKDRPFFDVFCQWFWCVLNALKDAKIVWM